MKSCALASLAAVVVLVSFPVRSLCNEDIYKPLTVVGPRCCVGGAVELKRFGDIDPDSFVSLMGRRRAAPPNGHGNNPMTRKRRVDLILADLLERSKQGKSEGKGPMRLY